MVVTSIIKINYFRHIDRKETSGDSQSNLSTFTYLDVVNLFTVRAGVTELHMDPFFPTRPGRQKIDPDQSVDKSNSTAGVVEVEKYLH